jgi:flagellar motor switch protein FliG
MDWKFFGGMTMAMAEMMLEQHQIELGKQCAEMLIIGLAYASKLEEVTPPVDIQEAWEAMKTIHSSNHDILDEMETEFEEYAKLFGVEQTEVKIDSDSLFSLN